MSPAMRRGFTLIELVVVLAIIGVSLAVVTPALVIRGDNAGPGEATLALLRSARRTALERGRRIEVTIDPTTARAWIRSGDASARDSVVTLADGLDLRAVSPRSRLRFVFTPEGTAWGDTLSLVRGGHAWRLTVDPVDGTPSLRDTSAPEAQ